MPQQPLDLPPIAVIQQSQPLANEVISLLAVQAFFPEFLIRLFR